MRMRDPLFLVSRWVTSDGSSTTTCPEGATFVFAMVLMIAVQAIRLRSIPSVGPLISHITARLNQSLEQIVAIARHDYYYRNDKRRFQWAMYELVTLNGVTPPPSRVRSTCVIWSLHPMA